MPIIGILAVPAAVSCDTMTLPLSDVSPTDSCFSSVYERWVWSGGARAVAIPHDLADTNASLLAALTSNLNGFLFTGGGLDLGAPGAAPFMRTAEYIYTSVLSASRRGEVAPLHGTCQGMQLLSILGAGRNFSVLETGFDSEDLALPLILTDVGASRGYLHSAPEHILRTFVTQNATANLHHDGVPPVTFDTNAALRSSFEPLSVNRDRRGRPFVSTIQHRTAAYIVGTQWHPERAVFEWHDYSSSGRLAPDYLPHSADAVEANSWTARAFSAFARQNNRNALADATAAEGVRRWITYPLPRRPLGSILTGYDAIVFSGV